MAYVLGGANNEADGFTTAIANFALRAMHESIGMVAMTNVVTPTQGNEFLVPNFAPITYADYNPAANSGTGGQGGGDDATGGVGRTGGTGGSGVVVIRYADTFPAASTTGSPTVTTPTGFRVYTFTGSGSITF
jgi:hypothetical protein